MLAVSKHLGTGIDAPKIFYPTQHFPMSVNSRSTAYLWQSHMNRDSLSSARRVEMAWLEKIGLPMCAQFAPYLRGYVVIKFLPRSRYVAKFTCLLRALRT